MGFLGHDAAKRHLLMAPVQSLHSPIDATVLGGWPLRRLRRGTPTRGL